MANIYQVAVMTYTTHLCFGDVVNVEYVVSVDSIQETDDDYRLPQIVIAATGGTKQNKSNTLDSLFPAYVHNLRL